MTELEFHPLANIFPLVEGAAYADLQADVLRYGVREPIWLCDGKILDGRNRYRAAQSMGVEFSTREYVGDDAAAFVVSLNLHRRHLSESQRAMVAAKLANIAHGGDRVSEQVANLQLAPITQADAADMLNVSPRSVAAAKKVMEEAPAEVVRAVEQGAMAVSLAAQVSELPDDDQELIAIVPADQMREVARQVVKAHVTNNSGNNEWYTAGQVTTAFMLREANKAKPKPRAKPKTGPKADAIREELKAAKDRGVSMISTYARLTITALRSVDSVSEEEGAILDELADLIQNVTVY